MHIYILSYVLVDKVTYFNIISKEQPNCTRSACEQCSGLSYAHGAGFVAKTKQGGSFPIEKPVSLGNFFKDRQCGSEVYDKSFFHV